MTHKQGKFGKGRRSRKVKQVEEEYECGSAYRRALLFSSDDVHRMAVESTRARLINHLVRKSEDHSPKEFTSYYCGPTRYLDPPYSITSHANRVPIPKIQQVIPTYPSLIQAPRWCPYSNPPSEQNSYTDLAMDRSFNCRCINCTSPDCPARYTIEMRPRKFKDNIMTFRDRYTMTRKVCDACCGTTHTPPTHNYSSMFVPCASSMVAVRDAGKIKIHEMVSRNLNPVPILKKCCPGSVYYDCDHNKLLPNEYQDEVVRDIEPVRTKSVKCFFRKVDDDDTDCEGEVLSRKNIYNEGISDVVAVKYPLPLKKALTPPPSCSRSSESNKSYSDEDNFIPHAHRTESKYHTKCKHLPEKVYVQDVGTERSRHQVAIPSPRIICKAYSKSCRRCKKPVRVIKLPKRVLTSERVVDTCVDKYPQDKGSPCRRR